MSSRGEEALQRCNWEVIRNVRLAPFRVWEGGPFFESKTKRLPTSSLFTNRKETRCISVAVPRDSKRFFNMPPLLNRVGMFRETAISRMETATRRPSTRSPDIPPPAGHWSHCDDTMAWTQLADPEEPKGAGSGSLWDQLAARVRHYTTKDDTTGKFLDQELVGRGNAVGDGQYRSSLFTLCHCSLSQLRSAVHTEAACAHCQVCRIHVVCCSATQLSACSMPPPHRFQPPPFCPRLATM